MKFKSPWICQNLLETIKNECFKIKDLSAADKLSNMVVAADFMNINHQILHNEWVSRT